MLPRYFPLDPHFQPTSAHSSSDFDQDIQHGLEKLTTKYPPTTSHWASSPESNAGLFSGPISLAHLLFQLSLSASAPHTTIHGKSLKEWSQAYLTVAADLATTHPPEPVTSQHCGIVSSITSYHAVAAIITHDATHVANLLAYLPLVLDTPGLEAYNEWIYGRTGFLYLMRLVRTHLPTSIPASNFSDLINRVLADGPESPTRWKWIEGRLYLGAGHGWMGILTQILLTDPSYSRPLQPLLATLLSYQQPNGNWPKYIPDPTSPHIPGVVQFGHDAPGIVISLLALNPLYAFDPPFQTRIRAAMDAAQDLIWTCGNLTKEPCLMHGTAGNSIALTDRARQRRFLELCREDFVERGLAAGELEASSAPAGGQRGLGGRVWAFGVWREEGKGAVRGVLAYDDV